MKSVVIGLLAGALALAVGVAVFAQMRSTATVEVRVWQSKSDASALYISARPAGGSWRELGTIPLDMSGESSTGTYRYGDIALDVPVSDAPSATPTPTPTPTAMPTATPTREVPLTGRIALSCEWTGPDVRVTVGNGFAEEIRNLSIVTALYARGASQSFARYRSQQFMLDAGEAYSYIQDTGLYGRSTVEAGIVVLEMSTDSRGYSWIATDIPCSE